MRQNPTTLLTPQNIPISSNPTSSKLLDKTKKKLLFDDEENLPPFQPYQNVSKYPKLIQKQISRKNSNIAKALDMMKTPSKQFCAKEIRRLSELTKNQLEKCAEIGCTSSSKKKRLFDNERLIQSELTKKEIDIENPGLDVNRVFMLPTKYKRRKHENESGINNRMSDPISDFSKSHDDFTEIYEKNNITEEMIQCEKVTGVEIKENNYEESKGMSDFTSNDENFTYTKYAEPEILFREIQNMQVQQPFAMSDQCMKVPKNNEYFYNEPFNFAQEISKPDLIPFLSEKDLGKENDINFEDENMNENEAQAPYIAPPFARVFSD